MSVADEIGHYAENSSPDITTKCSRVDQKERDSVRSHPVKKCSSEKALRIPVGWHGVMQDAADVCSFSQRAESLLFNPEIL